MSLLNIVILGIVQGLAELLPVSSSAHVVVTEKLLGLDPSSPPMTLLLVMLHTGTMFAVIVYFWRQWHAAYFRSGPVLRRFVGAIVLATALTGIIGEGLVMLIGRTLLRATPHAQIEDLFGHLEYIAPALAVGGVLIIVAGLVERRRRVDDGPRQRAWPTGQRSASRPQVRGQAQAQVQVQAQMEPQLELEPEQALDLAPVQAGLIGAVQGLSLPFRGFSRSGATISAGILLGVAKSRAEIFSFALAVVLTPPVVAREVLRLMQVHAAGGAPLSAILARTLFGALVAFLAGLVALKWLSRWLERGRWHLFGIYCLVAAAAVALLHHAGY